MIGVVLWKVNEVTHQEIAIPQQGQIWFDSLHSPFHPILTLIKHFFRILATVNNLIHSKFFGQIDVNTFLLKDIRTPLHSISAAAEELDGDLPRDPDSFKKTVHIIRDSADYLLNIVDQLIELQQIDGDNIVCNIETSRYHVVLMSNSSKALPPVLHSLWQTKSNV